jgi:dipeptidyl aminopeptidase/acylaminoacyl peptidase
VTGVTGVTGIPADLVARASTSYDAVRIHAGAVFWIEGRPDGRDALVRWTAERGARDVTPEAFGVGSRVHEYGGGAYLIADGGAWCCNADDQRLYWIAGDPGGAAVPVDPPPVRPGAVRYADLRLDPGGRRIWGVRERHGTDDGVRDDGVRNDVVAIPAIAGVGPPTQVTAGWDFYSSPRPSPDGRWLAWICWNAPLMPWDGAFLYVARLEPGGGLGEPVLVAGGLDESVCQPEWSPDGTLHFISDRAGWWNLYAWRDGVTLPVVRCEAELAVAPWEFGYATYAFLDEDRIAVCVQRGARQFLEVVEEGGRRRPVDLPYTSIKPYLSAGGTEVAFIASNPVETPGVVVVDVDTGAVRKLAGARPVADPESLARPQPFIFTTRDGAQVSGLFYPPSAALAPPVDHRAPLVVKAHPGPTANIAMRLDWHTQYLVSHGFAVAEVDYRGSTGYGRAFRTALRTAWGVADAHDCAEAAEYLAAIGRTDPRRSAIWGASAGGYTALRALALTRVFVAAVARCPVIDPLTWRAAAPKFQAHHADGLIGPPPDAGAAYRERSVLTNAGNIDRPVLLLHGDEDPITPVAETRALATELGGRAQLIVFPGEGHDLRPHAVQKRSLEAELEFFRETLTP